MDSPSQDDIKDCSLQKELSNSSNCDSPRSSSDNDAVAEEVTAAEKVVEEVLPEDVGTTHQPDSPHSKCKTISEECQSVQDVKCSDSPEEPVPDIHLIFPSSSENVHHEAQTSVDVSPPKEKIITQKFVTQTALDISHDTGLLNGPVQCNNGACEKVEINGCEGVSPDQDSSELDDVLRATVKSDSKDVSEVQESCPSVDPVESPGSVDGRERFRENCDQIEEINTECNSVSTQLACDRGDQICTSSISSNVVDKEYVIPHTTDVESDAVEQCVTSHLCTLADGTCGTTDDLNKHSLFTTLATSVVDEILDLARKRLLDLEIRNVSIRKNSLNCENFQEQISGNVQDFRKDVLESNMGLSVMVSNLDNSLDLNCSISNASSENTSNVLTDDECFQPADEYANGHVESNIESQKAVICNGDIVLSSHSTCLNNSSPMLNLSVPEGVSDGLECDSDVLVEHPAKEDDLKCEAKDVNSNDFLPSCGDSESVKEIDSCENGIMETNFHELSGDVKASCSPIATNLSTVEVDLILNELDLNSEAEVQGSKDVFEEVEGESFQVSNGACLKESTMPHFDNNQEEVTCSCSTTVLNVDECKNLNLNNQEPILEVETTLSDITAASSHNVGGNEGLTCAEAKLEPQKFNALDHITNSNNSFVNDEISCDVDQQKAKVEDIVENRAVECLTSCTSFQENTEKPEPIGAKQDLIEEGMHTVSDSGNLVSISETSEKEQHFTEKEEDSVKEMDEVVSTCVIMKEELISGKEDILEEEVISSVESVLVSTHEKKEEGQNIVEEENSVAEVISTADSSASDSSHDNVQYSEMINSVEEPKSGDISLKDDITASIPLLENNEDLAGEEQNSSSLLPGFMEIPEAKQDSVEAGMTSNHSEENGHIPPSTMPCQFIVPAVNVCPPILEETYDGITDDESEISHATSDSESDSNAKMVKLVCEGMNTINYRPLLEEDSNERSTLSLISELDEMSVREDSLDNEHFDDESSNLIMDDSVDKVDQIEKDNLSSNSELVQRVKGQRIKHDKKEELTYEKEKPLEDDSPKSDYASKIKDIRDALKSDSLERLRELARSEGGLVNDNIRREAWPRLLGIKSCSSSNPLPPMNMEELRKHHEYNQVVLDVNRSLRRFPSKISHEERVKLQDQLTEIILRVLMKRKDLSYYQGYHDVAVTTLLVAGKDAAFHILEHISIAHLSDCMLPTMERTMYLLNYIYPLLQRINPSLAERMDRLEIGTIFCLPWFLTWYGYSFNRYENIVRVFDYFLASPPLAPLYLAAVVVGRRSAEVLAADSDHATVHSLLARIPETLPLEDLLQEATDLYRNYPPDDIEREVHERCERLRKAQEEEEEERKRIRQRRMLQRRHSLPVIEARQMPGWFILNRFLGLPMIQGRRFIQVSATLMFGVIAWNLRTEVYRYF